MALSNDKGSSSAEFEGSGSEEFEEFKGSDSEEFEESSIKESKARKFGISGNTIMDDFILEKKLKWIPYNKFKNVKYLNEGGFGTIYKAIWLKNNRDEEVILKCHKNLNENLNEFLKEWEYHTSVLISNDIIDFYGFTDPNTSKYMVVMDYANKGNLRENLARIVKNNWYQKLLILHEIISGLDITGRRGTIVQNSKNANSTFFWKMVGNCGKCCITLSNFLE
ncbi:hypothetical protein RhiirA4_486591 [Rhizophagus irregularis]|uniref:Protein kinase domain-containing protein n=1 Tax=Rhizophagus irregularis TaxID=588596 RepID=A0A2I1HRK0_9GLOM|nr:hypothetical protein RhiirA4_486591 [Rhizophagus irregularis]